MSVCVISSGWRCWPAIERTVASIDMQADADYSVCITDDASQDEHLRGWITETCEKRGWSCILRDEKVGAVRNQWDAIHLLDPAPDDIIVWLDPDGDRFKHEHVIERIKHHYADGTQLAYFQYECDPPSPTSSPSRAYPPEVIRSNSYREFSRPGRIWWSHLRAMRAGLVAQMDESDMKDDNGQWFTAGTDSAFMFPGLELARGRVKFVDEVLYVYRPDYELSDWKRQPRDVDRAHDIILSRPPKCTW